MYKTYTLNAFNKGLTLLSILVFICVSLGFSWKRMYVFYANVLNQKQLLPLPHPRPLSRAPRQWKKMVSVWLHQPLPCLHLHFQRPRLRESRQDSNSSSWRSDRKSTRKSSSNSPLLLLGQKSWWHQQSCHRTQQQVSRAFGNKPNLLKASIPDYVVCLLILFSIKNVSVEVSCLHGFNTLGYSIILILFFVKCLYHCVKTNFTTKVFVRLVILRTHTKISYK